MVNHLQSIGSQGGADQMLQAQGPHHVSVLESCPHRAANQWEGGMLLPCSTQVHIDVTLKPMSMFHALAGPGQPCSHYQTTQAKAKWRLSGQTTGPGLEGPPQSPLDR